MFLGTSRRWWILAGVIFIAGLALLATGAGGVLGGAGGVVLIVLAMMIFAASPMRYGERASKPAAEPPAPDGAAPDGTAEPPRPRPEIVGRDAAEV